MPSDAKTYHDTVSYDRDAMSPHRLDWARQPAQSKSYSGVEPVPLPRVSQPLDRKSSSVLLCDGSRSYGKRLSSIEDLSHTLSLACAPTAVMRHSAGGHFLRSVPSAGALYPTEMYLACSGLRDLDDGVYHYDPIEMRLHRLRPEDPFPNHGDSTVRFFLSAIYFRSAWKYRSRSYRYHLLDTGHSLEALVLALTALESRRAVHLDFQDDRLNRLLGLDSAREVSMAWVTSGPEGDTVQDIPHVPPLPEHVQRASRVSTGEVDYADVREIHENGKVLSPCGKQGAALSMVRELRPEPHDWISLPPVRSWPSDPPYSKAVADRRSSRNFSLEPISARAFSAFTAALSAARHEQDEGGCRNVYSAVGLGLLVGRVEGTPPGFYLLDPEKAQMGTIQNGDLTSRMSRTCLDQAWLARAALHVLVLADLEALDRTWGARGYRYAMLAAGRIGHRVYLAATALNLGCCGIGAFYDGEAGELLTLGGTSRLLYLVATGPVRGGLR